MEAVGQDAKAYEALTGHSFQMGLKHYQQYHKARQDKAEGRLMEFWSKLGQEAGAIGQDSANVAQNVALQDGRSDYPELQDSENPIAQVLENQGFLQNEKTPCVEKQGVQDAKIWAKLDSNQRHLPCKGSALTN